MKRKRSDLGIKISQKVLMQRLLEETRKKKITIYIKDQSNLNNLDEEPRQANEEDLKILIDLLIELISDNLITKGHVVEIRGFGKFYLKQNRRFKTYKVHFELGNRSKLLLKEINEKYGGIDGKQWARSFFQKEEDIDNVPFNEEEE